MKGGGENIAERTPLEGILAGDYDDQNIERGSPNRSRGGLSSSESSEDLKFLQKYVSNEFKRQTVEAWDKGSE